MRRRLAYKILYTKKALKYLESLNRKEAQNVYRKIESIKENPLHYIAKLSSVDIWKLGIGDYRAIIRLDRAKEELTIVDIGHRKNIYKNL